MLRVGYPLTTGAIAIDDDRWFKQLFELSPDPVWIIANNQFIECNEAAVRTLGYLSREEVLNVHPSKLSPPQQPDGEDSYAKAERMMTLVRDNGLHRFEWIHNKADGTDFFAEVTLSVIEFPSGQVIYCVWRDITERKQADAALRENEARYSTLIQHIGEGISFVDSAERFTFANQAAENIFGVPPGGLQGRTLREFTTSAQFGVIEAQTRHRQTGEKSTYEIEIDRPDGVKCSLLVSAVPQFDVQGKFAGALGVFRDITECKQAEQALRESEARFRDITFSLADWVWEIDEKCCYTYSSAKGFDYFGPCRESIIGKTPFELMPPDEAKRVAAIFARIMTDKAPIKDLENWNITARGEKVCLLTNGVPILDAAGNLKGYRGVDIDITERKQMEEQVRQLAFYDLLTQLPNRRLLDDRLTQALAESKRSNRYGALIFFDLDDFKVVNDKHGHAVGDLLLVQAAQRMKSCVREVDTVVRHGGDEFVVMLGDLAADKGASTAQAGIVAEKIRAALAEPYVVVVKHDAQADTLVELRCTASIGVVVFIDREGTQDDFLRLADSAMYQAKEEGGNLIRFSELGA
ncbi:PAS domain S-box protein [Rhodoferax sp.]|uniref:sensor domain-containing protein n=1 Tax=Rhodoferax sp. TaxID=50421 RepID=UPI0025F9D18E|nr:PAS domain S-box protein [Rhodoferax sp.]MCM2341346.1 PAS domain S-box protein [Rhodoferax sp.]